ncbi:MAG: hypothetical protein AAFX06_16410 [Planctomycetota bacterium]
MARIGIVAGLALCVVTAMALVGTLDKTPLLLMPMMIGIPILFFGVVALNPHRRRHAIGISAVIGTLGLLIGCGEVFQLFSVWHRTDAVNIHSVRVVGLMIAICIGFLVAYGCSSADWIRPLAATPKRGN